MKPQPPSGTGASAHTRCLNTESVEEVTDLDYGRYLVITASTSAYVLDVGPASSSLVRSPASEVMGEWEVAPLRRDWEAVPLLGIIRLRKGTSAVFRIDVRGDGVETTRVTTPVGLIRRLPE